MTKEQENFIEKIGNAAVKYYSKYKILPSMTIAQAILESGWGSTMLATECNNYFGMKWVSGCGCSCKEYQTKEQRSDGAWYTIQAKFRKYLTLEDGIKGYYDFLQYPRYKNLKGVTDYKEACKLIRQDGWATALSYTESLVKLIETYKLTNYDEKAITGNKTSYYKKYVGNSCSLVDALQSIGVDSSFSNRKKIAAKNGIKNYTGTAEQNTKILKLLKQCKLKK